MGIEVFALEPNPRAFRILRRVVPKAHLYPYAVGNEDRDGAGFSLSRSHSHGRLAETPMGPSDESDGPVRMVRLDSLKFPRVAVIKIDTEGSELSVLEGAAQLIKRDMPRAIIEIHQPFEKQKELVVRFMREKGYTRIRQVWKPFRSQYHLVFFEPEKNGSLPDPLQSDSHQRSRRVEYS
jgi:FkbM family methyltransferase